MLNELREKLSGYLPRGRDEEEFPADFSFIDSEQGEKYLSYKFITELDYPEEDGILLDENVAFDMIENTNRIVEAYLDDSEVATVMSVLGYEPERENLTPSGQYHYQEEFNSDDIEEMLEIAYQQEVDIFYVEQVEDIMRKNGTEEQTVQQYMEELDKIAEPVTVDPIQENIPMDVAIALKAEQENLNLVTSDVDFIEQPFVGMDAIDNSIYTPHQMKQLLDMESRRE